MERPKLPRFQKYLQNHYNYQMIYIALRKHTFHHIMIKLARSRPELCEILPNCKRAHVLCDTDETPSISKAPQVHEVSRRIKKLAKPTPGLPKTTKKKKHHSRERQRQDHSAGVPPQKLKNKKWIMTLGRQYHVPVKVMTKPSFRYRPVLIPDGRIPLCRCSRGTSPRQQLDVPVNQTGVDAPNADRVEDKGSPTILDFPGESYRFKTGVDAPNADRVKDRGGPTILDFPRESYRFKAGVDAPNADRVKDKGSPTILDFPRESYRLKRERYAAVPKADRVKDKGSPEVLDFPKGSNKLKRDGLKSSPVKVTPEMDKEFYETLPSYADMQKWKKEDALGRSALLEANHLRLEKGSGVPDSRLPAACEAKESKAECEHLSKTKTIMLPSPSSLAVIASLRVVQLAQLIRSEYERRDALVMMFGDEVREHFQSILLF